MMTSAPRRIAVVVPILLFLACGHSSPCRPPLATVLLHGSAGASVLRVELATTPGEQAKGLMGRTSLPGNDGMLFLFDRPTTASFWMKDTVIPLSIAFYDGRGRVVTVRNMRPCTHGPCARYHAARPYMGAIEANRGYFQRHGIGVGDRVRPRIAGCA